MYICVTYIFYEKNVREYRRAIENEQSRETGSIGYTIQRKTKQKQQLNTICVGHHYAQTNTNNVNKTWSLRQITNGGKNKPTIVCMCICTSTVVVIVIYSRSNKQSATSTAPFWISYNVLWLPPDQFTFIDKL